MPLKTEITDANEFAVFGPFKLKYLPGTTNLCQIRSTESVLDQIKRDYPHDNLESKGGCYIFAVCKGGKGAKGGSYKPLYVGQSVGRVRRHPLIKESLSDRNFIDIYNKHAPKHGTLVLFWIAKAAPGMVKSLNKREIANMEAELIRWATHVNPSIENARLLPALSFKIKGLPLTAQCHHKAKRGPARIVAKMLGVI